MAVGRKHIKSLILFLIIGLGLFGLAVRPAAAATQQDSGSTGIQGTIPSPPPATGATIEIPKNGQSFSNLPITVSGLCPANTLVEIYSNDVFVGSAQCTNGSYSLQVNLFDGRNDLVAKVYDNLNQKGPDSNTVTVTYSSPVPTGGPHVLLTTQYAKRGADPGDILSWPIAISGGKGPYAISVDWGDKTNSDLISVAIAGSLNIQHTYAQSGVYKVTIRATDANGDAAFLQVVAVANGPVKQTGANNASTLTVKTVVLIWPLIVLFALMVTAFFIGKRHQLEAIKNRLRKGQPPF